MGLDSFVGPSNSCYATMPHQEVLWSVLYSTGRDFFSQSGGVMTDAQRKVGIQPELYSTYSFRNCRAIA